MNKKAIIFGILVVLWMGFIFLMSSTTGDESGKTSSYIVNFIIMKYDKITKANQDTIKYHQSEEFINKANHLFRKICHFGEYLILGILIVLFLLSFNKYKIWLCLFSSCLFSFFYASLDEYHQTFVAGRGGRITDIIIDSTGAIVGSLVIYLLFLMMKNIKSCK